MRPRIIRKGDEESGNQYVKLALLELAKLKDLMKFRNLAQGQRKALLTNGTVIRCQSVFGDETITIETIPQKLEEEEEKEYEKGALLLVLRKLIDDAYDYWYWDISAEKGYHTNPNAKIPATPEIISTWWSCNGFDEVEYYTVVSPAFTAVSSGGCGDSCGLLTFTEGACCDESEDEDDDTTTWYLLPCGGEVYYDGIYGWLGRHVVDCDECGNGQQTMYTPGAKNTRTRTQNESTHCDQGYSWSMAEGDLTELMEIGPRSISGGKESSVISSAQAINCSPFEKHWMRCYSAWDEGGCNCGSSWLPAHRYMVCEGDLSCMGYHGEFGDEKLFQATDTYGHVWGHLHQGCVTYDKNTKATGDYREGSTPLATRITSSEHETVFEGSWTEDIKYESSEQITNIQGGWNSGCLTCSPGSGAGASQQVIRYAFTELSYGVAGWRTVVASDGRIAVLIPKLSLSASAISTDGDVSGSIISTTTALLRIVDDSDHDYELAEGDSDYSLGGIPAGRGDLLIKPECYNARDIPLEVDLQGFHWLTEYDEDDIVVEDNILTAFVMDSTFYAYLATRTLDESWQNQGLSAFEQWVVDNNLESHAMFLHRRREYEEEIRY